MSSQSGSSDVSKKLKAAIRAKLEELGVYVDDELPDYIMVMIANKKEKTQMKDDLSLFIGKSTAKFVDWLFDLFDRLQNASTKPGESSRKEDEKNKESAAKEQEDKHRKEKEARDRELQSEKERERERQKERDREKRAEEEKRRERDEKRKEVQKNRRRRSRSRSNTYSDDEDRSRAREKFDRQHRDRENRARSPERKRVASTVIHHQAESPERKVQSTVTVKRNIRPSGDSNVKARGSMFLRAMNEASVSAGYGSSKKEGTEDDWSDVEALPSKPHASPQTTISPKKIISPKKSIRERLTRVTKEHSAAIEDDDTVVLGNQPQTGGPQMILKLSGGKEAIKKTRIQDRIVVVDDNLRRGLLKRKAEATDEPKSKHERIIFDIAADSRDSTPTDDSPTMQKWNGQIRLGDTSDSEDEEAEIDAFVAEARGINRKDSVREEEDELPPTHQLSGKSYTVHVNQHYQQHVPAYIPTPLSVLQEQQNQLLNGGAREDQNVKERCIFWPKCTKGDACAFMHPTKACTNFPNCSYGVRCLFIHPPCRFDRFCTKKHCPFTHQGTGGIQPGMGPPEIKNPLTSNRAFTTTTTSAMSFTAKSSSEELPKPLVRGALGSLAEKLAASIKKKSSPVEKKEEKSDENEKDTVVETKKRSDSPNESNSTPVSVAASPTKSITKPPLPENVPLQNMILCRYAGGCRNPVCHFKHPKECRFGVNCRNSTCYFYHKPAAIAPVALAAGDSAASAKYKWTASS